MVSYRSSEGTQGMKRFLKEKLEEVQGYMEEHIEMVKYYHSGFTYLDCLYFVRDFNGN
ncbi:RteC domain-containing protein [uncultured Sunxiuqinia sp.]|uniref:RteC domain-containing protein n=1 Tax=uncultured Sunxiuqinia sp. TaxID=1573825 RepID=UPI002AA64483|nr:RteC domain-containing protein [uncultured Sunxiuqinia sp.]